MKLSGIDANLLVALDALLRERNVTRAAAKLGVGQPALSHSLARLREHFKDPLLVPKGRQLVLSDKGTKLAPSVTAAAAALADVFEERPSFDPRARSAFAIAAGDLFAWRFVPAIAQRLAREAPGIELEVRPLMGRSTAAILGDGVDLAFGAFEDVPPEINQQHLFRDPFVCVVRADHPLVGATLPLKTYVKLPHIEVAPAPNARPGVRIDRLLAARGLERRVATRVPYFLLAAQLLAASDQVLTMTQRFAEVLTGLAPLKLVKCPLPIPPLSFSQIWSRDHDHQPAHRWVRDACASVCGSAEDAAND
jgi:DNA-binding transcriptional LysR family regulator